MNTTFLQYYGMDECWVSEYEAVLDFHPPETMGMYNCWISLGIDDFQYYHSFDREFIVASSVIKPITTWSPFMC
jgi:hypothetical protein